VSAVTTNYKILRNNVERTAAWLKELAYIYCGDVADDSKVCHLTLSSLVNDWHCIR
jgi:hypothetical protein